MRDRITKWSALPPVRVEGGILQSLVDIRSDERVIISMTEEGATRSVRLLTAPLTFVAGDDQTQSVWGIRSLNQAELVRYRW